MSNIKKFTITDEKIDPRDIVSVNREMTESPIAVLVELSVSFVLILRVELYRAALFVSLRNKRLDELEAVTE